MKKWKKCAICIGLLIVELLIYWGASSLVANHNAKQPIYYRGEHEFLKTIDCAELFDAYPDSQFKLEFEICAKKPGEILVYQQNGVSYRYAFWERINVSEEFQKFTLVVEPVLVNEAETSSYLAFYGEYGSGVIPTVRGISIEPMEK